MPSSLPFFRESSHPFHFSATGTAPWLASVRMGLAAFVDPTTSDNGAAAAAQACANLLPCLARRLSEWLHNVGPEVAVSLDLRFCPAEWTLEVDLVLDVMAPSRSAVRDRMTRHHAALARILRADAGTRWRPVARVCETPSTVGWRCQPIPDVLPGKTTLWVPSAAGQPDPAARGDLVRTLLAGDDPVVVRLTVRPVCRRRVRSVTGIVEKEASRQLALVLGHSAGAKVSNATTEIQQIPEALAPLRRAAVKLEGVLTLLRRLEEATFDCALDVLGRERADDAVLHAVLRAFMPGVAVHWSALTEDQVALIERGPHAALACPMPLRVEGAGPGPSAWMASSADRWRDGVAISAALEVPAPGSLGLPGIPLEAGRSRQVARSVVEQMDGFLLGEAQTHRGLVPVRIAASDLARHLYVCGKTGVGKSTLLESLVADLAIRGEGVGLVDPHGDLSRAIALRVGRRRHVVHFDPADPACPGLDPLWHDGSVAAQEQVVESITDAMFRLYPAEYMGPMFDRHSRALLIPLVAGRRGLTDLSRMASDDRFRRGLLTGLEPNDPCHEEVLRFWQDEYPRWGRDQRGEMQSYVISKYDALLRGSAMRRIVSADRPQLDLGRVLERGDVVLASLARGSLGPVSAWFLGMMLVGRIQQAVFARVRRPVEERRPYTLVLDEFQNLLGQGGYGYTSRDRTLGPLLSESRKFGLRLVLANQFVHQLDDGTREAILGNVGNFICMRVGTTDSERLARELGGGVSARELRELPLYGGLARLLSGGELAPLFSLRTIPPSRLDAHLDLHGQAGAGRVSKARYRG